MANPRPDPELIDQIVKAETTHAIYSLLSDGGIKVFMDALLLINGIAGSYRDKADLIEFCIRHGGVTIQNAQRFVPEWTGLGQRTNRCGSCRRRGHQATYCPW